MAEPSHIAPSHIAPSHIDKRPAPRDSRGPSFPLLTVGLAALALSIWTLIGPAAWPAASMIPIGWIMVGTAIVVGLMLVLYPGRGRRGSGPS
ncbi:hypothetical protein [Nocardia paucivorans]|uniref:hypothetical protein n=1 Tax=Nocardia paucivorans TaxID=114259 RepID=UPI00030B1395|nr:hypothetical protein [Nocardia paucivorans]